MIHSCQKVSKRFFLFSQQLFKYHEGDCFCFISYRLLKKGEFFERQFFLNNFKNEILIIETIHRRNKSVYTEQKTISN